MAKFLIVLLLTASFGVGFGEIFSAIDELEKLAYAEKQILTELEVFSERMNDSYVNRFDWF